MIMNIPWIEWVGYIASLLVLLSMLMKSVLRLRIINVFGCVFFIIYGLIIKAYPVAIVNLAIALVNIYYIYKMKLKKTSQFSILYLPTSNDTIENFINFHLKDIKRFNPNFFYHPNKNYESWILLRDTRIAGMVMGNKTAEHTFTIHLDYILPSFRDFKPGAYLYEENPQQFTHKSYFTLITHKGNKRHNNYLKKMGFEETGSQQFIKKLR